MTSIDNKLVVLFLSCLMLAVCFVFFLRYFSTMYLDSGFLDREEPCFFPSFFFFFCGFQLRLAVAVGAFHELIPFACNQRLPGPSTTSRGVLPSLLMSNIHRSQPAGDGLVWQANTARWLRLLLLLSHPE